jgi:predicted nucleic acid-binding protein
MVLVDSSVWIEALRRQGDLATKVALEALLEVDGAVVSGPILLEVLGGCRPADRKRLVEYFGNVPYRRVPHEAWWRAMRLSWRLRADGVTIPWNDLLIGSLGLLWDLRIFAVDRHFDILESRARVRRYRPGPGGAYADA